MNALYLVALLLSFFNDVRVMPNAARLRPWTDEAPVVISYKGDGQLIKYALDSENDQIGVYLERAPVDNQVVLDFSNVADLNFWYQPPLNEEHPDRSDCTATDCPNRPSVHRPINSIDSYAVYHAWKRDHVLGFPNYATGKVFHIHRASITHSDGSKEWVHESYSSGRLTIILPENETYPLLASSIFGYNVAGSATGSPQELNPSWLMAWIGNPGSSGNIISSEWYGYDAHNPAQPGQMGIYSINAGNTATSAKIDVSNVDVTPGQGGGAIGWVLNTSYSGASISSATKYGIFVGTNATGDYQLGFDSSPAGVSRNVSWTYGTWATSYSSFGTGMGAITGTSSVSIYATYSGGATARPCTMSLLGVGSC